MHRAISTVQKILAHDHYQQRMQQDSSNMTWHCIMHRSAQAVKVAGSKCGNNTSSCLEKNDNQALARRTPEIGVDGHHHLAQVAVWQVANILTSCRPPPRPLCIHTSHSWHNILQNCKVPPSSASPTSVHVQKVHAAVRGSHAVGQLLQHNVCLEPVTLDVS